MSKPRVDPTFGISSVDVLIPSDIRHVDGAKLNQALVRNVRTWPAMPREKAQAAPTARPKVPMRRREHALDGLAVSGEPAHSSVDYLCRRVFDGAGLALSVGSLDGSANNARGCAWREDPPRPESLVLS